MPYRSVNPATGEVLKTFTEHTDQEMMDALAKADSAFVSWAARPIQERAKIIARAAQLLLEQKSELAELATLEMGKRIAESRGEAAGIHPLLEAIIKHRVGVVIFLGGDELAKLDHHVGDLALVFGNMQALDGLIDRAAATDSDAGEQAEYRYRRAALCLVAAADLHQCDDAADQPGDRQYKED